MSAMVLDSRARSPKKASLSVLPYDQYIKHLNNTILARNITTISASTSHATPYTPMAHYMSPANRSSAQQKRISHDNSLIRGIIEQENKRSNKHGVTLSPVLQRMINNENAVRRRRLKEIDNNNEVLCERIKNAKSDYSPTSTYMHSSPNMIKQHRIIRMRNEYDDIAEDYEEFEAFEKQQARERSYESQLIGKYCNEYQISPKESREYLSSKGGVRRIIEMRTSSKQEEQNQQTENWQIDKSNTLVECVDKAVGEYAVEPAYECFDHLISESIVYESDGECEGIYQSTADLAEIGVECGETKVNVLAELQCPNSKVANREMAYLPVSAAVNADLADLNL